MNAAYWNLIRETAKKAAASGYVGQPVALNPLS
jgi:hypothetical protein